MKTSLQRLDKKPSLSYEQMTKRSLSLYREAIKVIPAGCNSYVRYFEPYPLVISKANGSRIYDADENEYIDYNMGSGAIFLGHSFPTIVKAVTDQLQRGSLFSGINENEIKLAKKVVEMVPCAEQVLYSNTGTEADMLAVRIARAYTRKKKIIKFEGHFHGWSDNLLKGVSHPYDRPMQAGMLPATTAQTEVLPMYDEALIRKAIKNDAAAVILEPVQGSGGAGIHSTIEFMKFLKEITSANDIPLMFDEIITGFRMAPGGAQEYFGVTPDIAILGKILGGGFPVGAVTGRADILRIADYRQTGNSHSRWERVYPGGTFSANPITTTAGLTALNEISKSNGEIHKRVTRMVTRAKEEMNNIFQKYNIKAQALSVGPIFGIHFTTKKIKTVRDLVTADYVGRSNFELYLLTRGIFRPPPNGYFFVSASHSNDDVTHLISATEDFAKQYSGKGH